VVVASFRHTSLLEATLAALIPQCAASGADLVVARAAPRSDTDLLAARYPSVTFVGLDPGTPLPAIRGAGLALAVGDPVGLTEDHCVPAPDWLAELSAACRSGADVAGGGMAHAPNGRLVDWAAYFSEYGFFSHARPPAPAGAIPLLTGANVGYGRTVVSRVAEWMTEGAWENVVHDRLAAEGRRMTFVPGAVIRHNHSYRFGAFCADRYQHGLGYARDRLAELGSNRWARLGLVPLLPWVLLARVARSAAPESPSRFVAALPLTWTFLAAWAWGEARGYLASRPE